MIDPIQSFQLQRPNTAATDSPGRTKKEKVSPVQNSAAAELNSQSLQDSVSLKFNIHGDLQTLQNSVATVYDQVKQQLVSYYGLRGEDGDPIEDGFLLPEDASAQEVLDFFSPENTSERILNFSTGFFGAYQANHSRSSNEENVNGFTDLIGEAIAKGFEEAEKILGPFEDLGEVGENIQKTYNLVLKGLENFRETHLNDASLMPGESEEIDEQAVSPEEGDFDVLG